ncbi:MAG TPA: tripartite tricarboxylate transporter substrate-binding protein [Xanthobacteraceae bacterium]|nr:tripartite tricarboxylate transporter substrate-binding protein [Xanthobacteraceae bacterium]
MDIERRRLLRLAGGLAALAGAVDLAKAETYPSRSARILVATSAGGGTDIAARLIAQWLTEKLDCSFFVENRPGGNNNIGTEAAAHATADGSVLFMANSVNTINASLYQKLNYNFIADFEPVVLVVRSPLLMMVHPSVPARTVPEFIAYAKARPNMLSMGSGGSGSSGHMAGELFMMMTGIKLIHVPYRGESLAMADLIAGQAQIVFATTGSALAFTKAGTVRPLAVTTQVALAAIADVPSLTQFLPGYEASGWSGLCAPKGTSPEIVAILNREVNAALNHPVIRQHIADIGGTPQGGTPAEFAKFIAEDTQRWAKVVKFAGIKPG